MQNKANVLNLSHRFYQKHGYERELARVFGFEQSMEKKHAQYWDVKLNHEGSEVLLELKKSGTGTYHMDNVKYCEMFLAKKGYDGPLLKHPMEAKKETVTCFMKTDNGRIEKIYVVDSDELFDILNIDETMAKQDLIRYEEYRRRDFYQNNQIGIRLKHIEAMAKVIDCVDLYCNHVLKYPPNIKGKRLENYKNGRRLGIDLSLGPNNLALNHTQETILLIAKRISKDNIFTVAELTDCLPELKKFMSEFHIMAKDLKSP